MNFVALICRCGLDLSTTEPVKVIKRKGAEPYGECPDCGRTYLVKPAPTAKSSRQKVSKPKVGPVPEPEE